MQRFWVWEAGQHGATCGDHRAAGPRPPECSLLKPPHWPLEGCGWPVPPPPPNTPHQQRRRGLQTANCCKRLTSRLGTGLTPPSADAHHSLLLWGHPGASRQTTRPVVEKSLPQISNKDTVPARRPPPASSPKEESKMGSGGPSRWQPVSRSLDVTGSAAIQGCPLGVCQEACLEDDGTQASAHTHTPLSGHASWPDANEPWGLDWNPAHPEIQRTVNGEGGREAGGRQGSCL